MATIENGKTVLTIVAHPDDAEFQCAGTLALLARKGWDVIIATMTPGQAGSPVLGPEEISAIRREEGRHAARVLQGHYECLECEDLFVAYDRPTLLKAITLLRRTAPSIVITASPQDYIVDHEITSMIARTACMGASIPNISIDGTLPLRTVPHLYYCDPVEGKDIYGQPVKSAIRVDITTVMDLKTEMLKCHKSQRDWLFRISNVDEYMDMMRTFSIKKGKEINCHYAEGFRQHLGFSYPQDDILCGELPEFVHNHGC